MCTIINPNGHTIATIPHSDRLYHIVIPNETQTSHHANAATGKMDINKAHRKLGHISPVAIKHAISKGYITGIELDNESKPDFCEACVKAKSARQPLLQTVFLFPFLFTLLRITKRLNHSMPLPPLFHAVSSFFSFNYSSSLWRLTNCLDYYSLQPHFSD